MSRIFIAGNIVSIITVNNYIIQVNPRPPIMLLESSTYARPVGGGQNFISGNICPKITKMIFLFGKHAC